MLNLRVGTFYCMYILGLHAAQVILPMDAARVEVQGLVNTAPSAHSQKQQDATMDALRAVTATPDDEDGNLIHPPMLRPENAQKSHPPQVVRELEAEHSPPASEAQHVDGGSQYSVRMVQILIRHGSRTVSFQHHTPRYVVVNFLLDHFSDMYILLS